MTFRIKISILILFKNILESNLTVWKALGDEHYFEQLLSNSHIWVEIKNGKVVFHYKFVEETAFEVTLFDLSRNLFVKLDSFHAYSTYNLSEKYAIISQGSWIKIS